MNLLYNKHLIIQLIKEDMKHEQLIRALQKLGFQSDLFDLDLSGVVAELMGVPDGDMSWDWIDQYMSFLRKVEQYEITGNGENLLPLAEACYTFLSAQLDEEDAILKLGPSKVHHDS